MGRMKQFKCVKIGNEADGFNFEAKDRVSSLTEALALLGYKVVEKKDEKDIDAKYVSLIS